MTTYEAARDLAREAARAAGWLCLAVREEMLGRAESMAKAGDEPVTVADFGAQAVILDAIARGFPGDAVYAEEHSADYDALADEGQRRRVAHYVSQALGRPISPDDVRRQLDHGRGVDSTRIWAIDPIDGTKGFLRGDQFAVAIGLLVEGVVEVAALACPMMPLNPASPLAGQGVVFAAARGQGAAAAPLGGGPERLVRVSDVQAMSAARVVESVESRHTDHTFSAGVMAAAGIRGETVRIDSQAKYGAVADGRAEVYIRHSPDRTRHERVWDHAAGALVIEEAGGTVTDLDGRPLDFGCGLRLSGNRGVLATNGPVHQAVLDAIRRVEAEQGG
jgi:HAL2 family 3'(2'),5'-bisphosphate nucleotidase